MRQRAKPIGLADPVKRATTNARPPLDFFHARIELLPTRGYNGRPIHVRQIADHTEPQTHGLIPSG